MSTLRVNTLQNAAGTGQPAMSGAAKAWVNFNGTGTVAIRASFNVTSITDNGTGDYTVNFTNALEDANYSGLVSCAVSSVTEPRIGAPVIYTAASVRVETGFSTFTNGDCDLTNVAVFR